MTDEMLGKLLSQDVEAAFKKNENLLVQELSGCAEGGEPIDTVMAKMVIKSMRLSVQMSATLIIRELEAAGVLKLPSDDAPLIWMEDNDMP